MKGIEKFNMKAKSGIKHWIEEGMLAAGNEKELAEIIFKYNSAISHERLGEIFGSEDPFYRKVLVEFVSQLNFKSQDILTSLREFLTYFQLHGEG